MTTADLTGMLSEDDFLEHMDTMSETMTEAEWLAHVGVKGMKWGKRRSTAAPMGREGAPVKTRSELRALNKESRKKDSKAYDSEIDAARDRVNSGANRKAYVDAKATYKADKKIIGKREAAKAFNAVKEKNLADYDKSEEAKSGGETVAAVLVGVAGLALLAYGSTH